MFGILSQKEIQIRMMLRLPLIPVRIAPIKNTTNAGEDAAGMCLRGCQGEGTLIHCW
jgi:hypothetical protein